LPERALGFDARRHLAELPLAPPSRRLPLELYSVPA
jgi:hypothetical protein